MTSENDLLRAEVERLRMLVLSARDAVNEYHLAKTSNALDELNRIAGMCNRGELLDAPYVRSVIESETAQLSRQLKDAVDVRDQRGQMANDARSEVARLTAQLASVPKTADGVPVVAGMIAYGDWDAGRMVLAVFAGGVNIKTHSGFVYRSFSELYSTPEAAAEAAKK